MIKSLLIGVWLIALQSTEQTKNSGASLSQTNITVLGEKNEAAKTKEQIATAFVLKGKIADLKKGWLYLYYSDVDGKNKKDSAALKNGNFSFKGKINAPVMAYLQLKEKKGNEQNSTDFFLEPTVMTVTLLLNKFKEAKFTGSKTQNEYAMLEGSKKTIEAKYKTQLDSLSREENHERSAEIRERLAPFFSEMNHADYLFFNDHPQSSVTAYLLVFHVSDLSLDSLQMYYDALGEKLQQTGSGKDLAREIQQLRWGSPGSLAKDFTATDIKGNKLCLSGFKGRYVLLDFWASWCVPCRKGNPHLKELYAKYKDRGIEFIGVSDDDSKPDSWRKAVEKDGLPWRHVLRGLDMKKRMNNEPNEEDISDKFGINSLPTKILIDKEGKIIGRYSEEEGPLDEMLKSIFGN